MGINSLGFVLTIAAAVVLLLFIYVSGVIRYIPNNRLGVLEKMWSGTGSIESGLIALKSEAGFPPDVLRGGFHVFMPFQYRVHPVPLVTIPQGQIGYVFARDGAPSPLPKPWRSMKPPATFRMFAHS